LTEEDRYNDALRVARMGMRANPDDSRWVVVAAAVVVVVEVVVRVGVMLMIAAPANFLICRLPAEVFNLRRRVAQVKPLTTLPSITAP
jgi:hypothetical protein